MSRPARGARRAPSDKAPYRKGRRSRPPAHPLLPAGPASGGRDGGILSGLRLVRRTLLRSRFGILRGPRQGPCAIPKVPFRSLGSGEIRAPFQAPEEGVEPAVLENASL